ncbi:DNA-binding protein HEXBP isoform X2 [Morus notabilis]|uniref:DNA-binding protein HEXBP isoform X2 n=1 Tax=Morus notabilis TaxID=981085 RepID=UPI000CED5974|nr:DNA-binding protein HEXBP isoform X2 [Morus notabilis]
MKIEAKRSVIEIQEDDDEDFFSQLAAVEADALASSKRRRITPSVNAVVPNPKKEISAAADEGLYMAALKGNQSLVRQTTAGRVGVPKGRVKAVDAEKDDVFGSSGSGAGNSCFKCGKSGHWARDCDSAPGGGGGQYGTHGAGSDPSIPEKSCPCGLGICTVLTANTEKNRGRKFYKCPLRQENGGCGFFEWCDNASGNNSMAGGNYTSDSSFPGRPCPCGAGLCLILTAKTGQNIGQQFYRCPANQWCNENTTSIGVPVSNPNAFYNSIDTNNTSYNVRTGSSCFKCGKEGHWARDCSVPSSNPAAELGGRSASSGTCYKCGKPGHWSRDCSSF